MPELLIWLAMWLLPTALVVAWIWADTWLAGREDERESLSERHDRLDAEAVNATADLNIAAYERLGREANR